VCKQCDRHIRGVTLTHIPGNFCRQCGLGLDYCWTHNTRDWPEELPEGVTLRPVPDDDEGGF
jgi:hypothetical protein